MPLDRHVLTFTLSLSLLTYLLSGVLPVLSSRQGDLRSPSSGRGLIGGGGLRLRQALIAGEVALTVVLLAATGLLIRTLIGLQTIPPGFNPTGVITAKASLDDTNWQVLQIIPGDGSIKTVTNSTAPAVQRYYRLLVQ